MDNSCLDEKTSSFLNMNNNKNTGSVDDSNFTRTPSLPCYQNVNQSNLSSNSSSGGNGGAGGRKGKKPQKYQQQHPQEIPSFLPLTEADARKIKTEEENDSNYSFEAGKDKLVPSSQRNTAPVKISPYGIDAILSNNTQHAHTPKAQINSNNQIVMTHHSPVSSSHMDLAEIIRQRLIQNAAKKLSSSTTIDPTVKPSNDGECINVKNSSALSRPLSKESFESSNQSHQTFCHEKNDRNDSTKGTNNTADIPIKRPRGRPPGSCNKNPKKSKNSPNSSVVNQPYLGCSNEGATNVLNSSQDPSTVLSSFMDPLNFDMMKFFQFVQQNNTGLFPPVPPVPSFQDVQQKMAANAFDPLALWASTMNMLSTSSNQFNLPPTINSDTNYKKLTQDFMGNGNLENNEAPTNHMRNEVPKHFSSVSNSDPLKSAQDHEDIRHSKEIITPQSIKSSRNSSPISRTKGKSSKAKPGAVQGGIDAQQPIVKRSVGRPPKVPKIPITIGTVANNSIVLTSNTSTYSNPKNINTDQNISFSNNTVGKNMNEIEKSLNKNEQKNNFVEPLPTFPPINSIDFLEPWKNPDFKQKFKEFVKQQKSLQHQGVPNGMNITDENDDSQDIDQFLNCLPFLMPPALLSGAFPNFNGHTNQSLPTASQLSVSSTKSPNFGGKTENVMPNKNLENALHIINGANQSDHTKNLSQDELTTLKLLNSMLPPHLISNSTGLDYLSALNLSKGGNSINNTINNFNNNNNPNPTNLNNITNLLYNQLNQSSNAPHNLLALQQNLTSSLPNLNNSHNANAQNFMNSLALLNNLHMLNNNMGMTNSNNTDVNNSNNNNNNFNNLLKSFGQQLNSNLMGQPPPLPPSIFTNNVFNNNGTNSFLDIFNQSNTGPLMSNPSSATMFPIPPPFNLLMPFLSAASQNTATSNISTLADENSNVTNQTSHLPIERKPKNEMLHTVRKFPKTKGYISHKRENHSLNTDETNERSPLDNLVIDEEINRLAKGAPTKRRKRGSLKHMVLPPSIPYTAAILQHHNHLSDVNVGTVGNDIIDSAKHVSLLADIKSQLDLLTKLQQTQGLTEDLKSPSNAPKSPISKNHIDAPNLYAANGSPSEIIKDILNISASVQSNTNGSKTLSTIKNLDSHPTSISLLSNSQQSKNNTIKLCQVPLDKKFGGGFQRKTIIRSIKIRRLFSNPLTFHNNSSDQLKELACAADLVRGLKATIKGEVVYLSPCGKKLRSYQDVDRYLDRLDKARAFMESSHKMTYNWISELNSRQNFNFSSKALLGDFYRENPLDPEENLIAYTESETKDLLTYILEAFCASENKVKGAENVDAKHNTDGSDSPKTREDDLHNIFVNERNALSLNSTNLTELSAVMEKESSVEIFANHPFFTTFGHVMDSHIKKIGINIDDDKNCTPSTIAAEHNIDGNSVSSSVKTETDSMFFIAENCGSDNAMIMNTSSAHNLAPNQNATMINSTQGSGHDLCVKSESKTLHSSFFSVKRRAGRIKKTIFDPTDTPPQSISASSIAYSQVTENGAKKKDDNCNAMFYSKFYRNSFLGKDNTTTSAPNYSNDKNGNDQIKSDVKIEPTLNKNDSFAFSDNLSECKSHTDSLVEQNDTQSPSNKAADMDRNLSSTLKDVQDSKPNNTTIEPIINTQNITNLTSEFESNTNMSNNETFNINDKKDNSLDISQNPTDHQNIGFSFEDMSKPKDDLEIMQNSKTLPDFPIIPNMQLSPKHFSDLVMVTEFLHSFSDVLHIDPANYTLYKLQNIICCQNIINGDDKTKSKMVKDEPVITDKSCAMEKLPENDESNTLILAMMPFQAFIKIVLKLVQFLLKHNDLLANATTLININNSICNNGGVYSNDMCSTIQTENEDFRENKNNSEEVTKEQNLQEKCAKTVTFTSSLDIRYNYDLGTFTFLGGKSVKDFSVCESNISEIVCIYLTIYNDTCYGETSSMSVEITNFLSLQPLHLLKAEQKSWLLAFLCDRLLDHPDILRELDRRLGIMANLKKDKWLNEGGQLRKQRYSDPITNNIAYKKSTTNHNDNIDVDKSTKKTVKFEDDSIENTASDPISTIVKDNTDEEPVKIDDQPSVKSEFVDQDMTNQSTSEIEYKPVTIKTNGENNSMVEKNDTIDNGKNVNSNITTDEKSNHPKEETSQSDQRRCESEIQHPEDRLSMYRMQLYEINTQLRCMSLGTDRYKRIYWVMPSIGAIFIEGFNHEQEQNNVANLDKSLINVHGVLTNNGKEENTERNNLLTPNYQNNWWYIDSREQLDNLMSSLNLRGIREKILYKNMQKITDVLLQMYPLESKSENGKLISNQFAEYIKSHELSSNNEAKIEPENFLKTYYTNAYKTVQRFEDKVITSNFMSKAWIKTHKPITNILINDFENDEIFSATRQKLLDLVSGIDRRFLRSPLCRPTKDLQDYEAIINWYNSNSLKDEKFDNFTAKTLENTITDRKLENMEEKVEMIPKEITDFDQNTHTHCDKNIIIPQDDIVNSSNQFSDSVSNDVSNNPNNLNNLQEDNATNSYAQTSSNLYKWKLALSNAKNTDQIYICLQLLQSAIAWEKSITKVFCQFCHLGSDEDLLLLCDGCDKGYHTYCFKPAIDKVPSGDWYCYSCVSKAINENLCSICGQSKQKLVRCDKCLRHFHERCFNSSTILQRSFKGIWKCPICQTNPKYAKTQNLNNNIKTIYYNHKNPNPHLNASLNSDKPLKNPDKKSDVGSNISKKNSENSITCLIKKRINHDQPKRDMSESETIDAICINTPKERLKENEKFTTSPSDSFSIAASEVESAIRPLPVTLQKIDRRRKIFRDYKKFKENPNVLSTRNDGNTNNLEHHTKEKNALFKVTMNSEPLEKSGINGINLKKYSSLGNKTINYKSSLWTSQEMKKRRGRKFKFVMSGNGDNGTTIRSQKGPKIKSLSNFSNNTTFSNTGNHNMYPTSQHSI